MSEKFAPVSTLAELLSLDEEEIVAGYMEYSPDDPEPGPNRGKAYWHGWRNAAMDKNRLEIDDAHRQLCKEYMHYLRKHRVPVRS